MPDKLQPLTREQQYWRYLIERGAARRYPGDAFWRTPERGARLDMELAAIEKAGYSGTFVMLASVLAWCREQKIPVGPGRGSVGGSYACYLAGIHDVDSLEYELLFERFINIDRVSFPDVDIDVSQRHRDQVIQYIVDTYSKDDQVVLQIGAFVRAGGRAVVDLMLSAMAHQDPQAGATATNLKKCFPSKGSITGGQKIQRELHAWLYEDKGHGDKEQFIAIAEQAGWLQPMLKLDGMYTHLGKHAAGVVILRKEDVPNIPTLNVRNTKGVETTVTAYDMYSLDDLGYLKWDWLGLRTLDVIVDAHKFAGGSGEMDDLLALWREHRDDPEPYELLQAADTVGIFQMETDGYRRTLRAFQPTKFDHVVQLVALYRPGAIDYKREDGKNMVDIFIDRMHGREDVAYPHEGLKPILKDTQGVILYQEQQMRIVRDLAQFTLGQADALRKAIGKKRPEDMKPLKELWEKNTAGKIDDQVRINIWENIEAAARYSWNKSHAVEYGIITWWTAWFKRMEPASFYAAEINSREGKKDVQVNVIGEARRTVVFRPPDINLAESRFIVQDGEVVFGLNGIKGMGDAYRDAILVDRAIYGPFTSFSEFCERLPSLPISIKLSLVRCGAFDRLEDRERLLSVINKTNSDKEWTVAEHLNHNRKLKNPRDLPPIWEWRLPTDGDLAEGEMLAIGYYISATPLKPVREALARHQANVIGGEISAVKVKEDRNGQPYADVQLITPDLTKQRVLMFWRGYNVHQHQLTKGTQLLFRGSMGDGETTYIADACWEPSEYGHFKSIKIWRDGEQARVESFSGSQEQIKLYEKSGYRVRLV